MFVGEGSFVRPGQYVELEVNTLEVSRPLCTEPVRDLTCFSLTCSLGRIKFMELRYYRRHLVGKGPRFEYNNSLNKFSTVN